ncbi:MAG TPA: nitrilase-related carbon-nitrogen hydrolase, partial [Woeseiaceae bacterium]|nr:nitrilase-related carbon-nitrogen hydrolase [Woeseiaceae bacterium]
MTEITLALAQADFVVGDVVGNTAKILDYANRARDELHADLAVFPELSVCGYPPEDLLFHSGLRRRVVESLETIRHSVRDVAVLLGYPEYEGDRIFNACLVCRNGKVLARYRKHMLPNYRVFDEERYFTSGKDPAVFPLNGIRIGLQICEDIWRPSPAAMSRAAGAEMLVAINGSPYELTSQEKREKAARARIAEVRVPLVYLNTVGGQDELVFDGGSFAMDADGGITFRAQPFRESLLRLTLRADQAGVRPEHSTVAPYLETERSVYEALVTGTRDYVNKNNFPGVIIGLSGGVDSALVLAVACDALGADRV